MHMECRGGEQVSRGLCKRLESPGGAIFKEMRQLWDLEEVREVIQELVLSFAVRGTMKHILTPVMFSANSFLLANTV